MANKQVSLTVSIEDELYKQFGAILVIKGSTMQDFLKSRIVNFVTENSRCLSDDEIKKDSDAMPEEEPVLTGIAATRAAIAEIRAGMGKRFDSVDEFMADLHGDCED